MKKITFIIIALLMMSTEWMEPEDGAPILSHILWVVWILTVMVSSLALFFKIVLRN